jgi:hypothetical protein
MAVISTEEVVKFSLNAHTKGGESIGHGTIYKKTSKAMLDSVVEVMVKDIGATGKAYNLTSSDIKEIVLAAIGDDSDLSISGSLEIVLPEEALLKLFLNDTENVDMAEVGELAEVYIIQKDGSLSPEVREQMITEMIADDIDIISSNLANGDVEFLESLLRGDSGRAQYSVLDDDKIRAEYAELKANSPDEENSLFDQDEDMDEPTKRKR